MNSFATVWNLVDIDQTQNRLRIEEQVLAQYGCIRLLDEILKDVVVGA